MVYLVFEHIVINIRLFNGIAYLLPIPVFYGVNLRLFPVSFDIFVLLFLLWFLFQIYIFVFNRVFFFILYKLYNLRKHLT